MTLNGKSRFTKQELVKPLIVFEWEDEAMHSNYDATPKESEHD